MGEIAEGVINGLYCESCCCLIDGRAAGYVRKCNDCKEDK